MVLHFFVSFFFSFTETKYNLKKKKYLSPDENVEDRRPPTGNPNEENEWKTNDVASVFGHLFFL